MKLVSVKYSNSDGDIKKAKAYYKKIDDLIADLSDLIKTELIIDIEIKNVLITKKSVV